MAAVMLSYSLCFTPLAHRTTHRPLASQLRHNLQAFLAGGVAALSFGYYRVHKDVWTAAEAVDSRLAKLGNAATSSQKALQARVDALENQVTKLSLELERAKEGA